MPADGMDRRTYRTAKFGSWEASQALDARILMQAREDGVPFAFDRITRTPSTKAAHRLTALVQHYHPSTLEAFLDAVFRAYFVEGRDIGDVNVLGQILVSVGLDRGLLLDRLRSGEATAAVEDMARQVRAAGVSGVPVFIIGETPFSGAQPIETLAQALTATAHTTRPDANHT